MSVEFFSKSGSVNYFNPKQKSVKKGVAMLSRNKCIIIPEPEIAVGHWLFSDQFQDLAEQK